ncbi:MAG: hypothetical protein CMI36_01005 [Owenweeksia sp.]|nr:hypothetical protein [Owenweeksia sp.]MBF97541.1 hypothetical protein [Owenweeksia sp.]HBF20944.1 hypothetical protein [Cryomorphaceae bacterium]|tara:strand:+ start:115 stop:294 length:180 start_codon:yes stop_codon:yes gene_type:complete
MTEEKVKNTTHNKAYSLWRVNGYQLGFGSVANFSLVDRKVLRPRVAEALALAQTFTSHM